MTLRHLVIFVTVCQEGSITAAAQKLYIAQPSISLAIKEMEQHYNHSLFDRYSRKLYINSFGKEVLRYAQSILAMYDELEMLCGSKNLSDSIRVGTGTAIGKLIMPYFVNFFQKKHPKANITVKVDRTDLNALAITNNILDFVIMESIPQTPNIIQKPLQSSPIVAVCNKLHPLAKKEIVTANDLIKCNLLLREKASPTYIAVENYFTNHNLQISAKWESISIMALINAVRENIGVAFLSLNHVQAVRDSQLVILNVKDFEAKRFINAYYHKDKYLTPLMREFLHDFVEFSNSYGNSNVPADELG